MLDKKPKTSFNSEGYCGNFTLNANDFEKYLQRPCGGEFLDCNTDKISKDEIDALFKTDSNTGLTNKRPFSDTTTTNEHSAKKFVFRHTNAGTINRTPSPASTELNRPKNNDNDGLFDSFHSNQSIPSTNKVGRREFEKCVQVTADIKEQRDIREKFHSPVLAQQNVQQNNQQNFQPSSNGQSLPASKTNESKYTFITAREELQRQNLVKNGQNPQQPSTKPLFAYGKSTKTLGTRRSVNSKFVPPITPVSSSTNAQTYDHNESPVNGGSDIDEKLKNIEPKMIELIQNEIMHQPSAVGKLNRFDDR